MVFKKVLLGLFSLLLCCGSFLGSVEAKSYSPEDVGYNVVKLTLGKTVSMENVYIYDNYYKFTLKSRVL